MELLSELVEKAKRQNLHIRNVAVARGGREIAQYNFREDEPIMLWSVSKSITSLAIGIAQGEELLSLEDSIRKYFPGRETGITIRDLLTMTVGHKQCPIEIALGKGAPIENIEEMFFSQPFEYAPGSRFVYDNTSVYMLSSILQKTAGRTLEQYCGEKLFAPLGISDFSWEHDENGISLGFAGLRLDIHALLKIGTLLLNGGRCEGRQIVPEDYVKQATSTQVPTDHHRPFFATEDHWQGYGYLFWMNSYHGSYRMDGMYGQYVVMLPDKNAVVAYLSEEPENMTGILELTWDPLLAKL